MFAAVSAHRGAVTRIYVNTDANKIYSVGDDAVVYRWGILGGRRIKLEDTITVDKLVSLVFGIG